MSFFLRIDRGLYGCVTFCFQTSAEFTHLHLSQASQLILEAEAAFNSWNLIFFGTLQQSVAIL